MKRTTIFLPEKLHEQLRRDAFRAKISMAELIRSRLQENRRPAQNRTRDPIMKVAGIYSGPSLSTQIDDVVYGG